MPRPNKNTRAKIRQLTPPQRKALMHLCEVTEGNERVATWSGLRLRTARSLERMRFVNVHERKIGTGPRWSVSLTETGRSVGDLLASGADLEVKPSSDYRDRTKGPCTVEGCDNRLNVHNTSGLCLTCYHRLVTKPGEDRRIKAAYDKARAKREGRLSALEREEGGEG
jgi:hypothetical protein